MTTNEDTIAARVEAFTQVAVRQLPEAALATLHAEQVRMAAAGVSAEAAKAGDRMPDGELLNPTGGTTSLAAERAGRPAVVVFYRGAWCPYCNLALRAYEQLLRPELAARGLVAVDGTIRWIDVQPGYGTRTEPAAILAAIAEHF